MLVAYALSIHPLCFASAFSFSFSWLAVHRCVCWKSRCANHIGICWQERGGKWGHKHLVVWSRTRKDILLWHMKGLWEPGMSTSCICSAFLSKAISCDSGLSNSSCVCSSHTNSPCFCGRLLQIFFQTPLILLCLPESAKNLKCFSCCVKFSSVPFMNKYLWLMAAFGEQPRSLSQRKFKCVWGFLEDLVVPDALGEFKMRKYFLFFNKSFHQTEMAFLIFELSLKLDFTLD